MIEGKVHSDEIKINVESIKERTENIKTQAAADTARLAGLLEESRRQQLDVTRKLQIAEHKLTVVQSANKMLAARVNALENLSRYNTLRIDGKTEQDHEDVGGFIEELFKFLIPQGFDMSMIAEVYRAGKQRDLHLNPNQHKPSRPRTIVVIFKSKHERNIIFYARAQLKNANAYKGIFINDDVSEITRRQRDEFRSVATLARNQGSSIKLHSDGLVIDGQKFKHDEAELLPAKFSLAQAKTVEIGEDIYFHSEHSFLSNFYPSSIVVEDGTVYQTAEHYYQAEKCRGLGSDWQLDLILKAQTPLDAKRIADRLIEGPNWRNDKLGVMEKIIQMKFDQNQDLAKKLQQTGSASLHEATADTYFGIGVNIHAREIKDKSYRGLDKLGQILQSVRDNLRTLTI